MATKSSFRGGILEYALRLAYEQLEGVRERDEELVETANDI